MTNRVPEIVFAGTRNHPKNGFTRQVQQGFSSFFAEFLPYLMICQSEVALRKFEKSSNMPKNCTKKSLVHLALNPFLS